MRFSSSSSGGGGGGGGKAGAANEVDVIINAPHARAWNSDAVARVWIIANKFCVLLRLRFTNAVFACIPNVTLAARGLFAVAA